MGRMATSNLGGHDIQVVRHHRRLLHRHWRKLSRNLHSHPVTSRSSLIASNMEPLTSWQFLDYLSERAYRLVRDDPASPAAYRSYFHDDVIFRGWIDTMLFDV